jgi:ATP-dependent RNA helicase DeaD
MTDLCLESSALINCKNKLEYRGATLQINPCICNTMPQSQIEKKAANPSVITFESLMLPQTILTRLEEVGYQTPSPIQEKSIPVLLQGKDIIGQAQTGTGKTAAFALPVLAKINHTSKHPQVLVLAPTRELCIQVCDSFKTYSKNMKGVLSIPIYGGQNYQTQFKLLKQNPQIVVGTPGRIMDHLKRGTLDISHVTTVILDEADEMLRMGFAEDVEWILKKTPKEKQTILFSATMPPQIRKLANTYLHKPEEITVSSKTATTKTIQQLYWVIQDVNKLDALNRILEAVSYDSVIVFVKTKNQTTELAERLRERGFLAVALNGDIAQKQREQTISQVKQGKAKILVATDVAARGLDIDTINYVINYDAPYDAETYIHRIGRTGRAGNKGTAILFVSPREKKTLDAIEHHTKQKVEKFTLPSAQEVSRRRINELYSRLDGVFDLLSENDHLDASYKQILEEYLERKDIDPKQFAALVIHLLHQDKPLLLSEKESKRALKEETFEAYTRRRDPRRRGRAHEYVSRGKKRNFRSKRT